MPVSDIRGKEGENKINTEKTKRLNTISTINI